MNGELELKRRKFAIIARARPGFDNSKQDMNIDTKTRFTETK